MVLLVLSHTQTPVEFEYCKSYTLNRPDEQIINIKCINIPIQHRML